MKIDDPTATLPSTFFCAIWGVIAAGLFSNEDHLPDYGRGKFIGYQIVGILSIICWCGSISWLYFYSANRMGLLRVDLSCEILGLDASYLGALRPWVHEIIHS